MMTLSWEKSCVPNDLQFATKSAQALSMYDHLREHGINAPWVTADCVYGDNPSFRDGLMQRRQKFVLEVSYTTKVWTKIPLAKRADGTRPGGPQLRSVAKVVEAFGDSRWRRLEVGEGSKGMRTYDWAAKRVVLAHGGEAHASLWLLARRSISKPAEVAYYLCFAPARTRLEELVYVAASRWAIEETIKDAKQEAGLDDYQVRTWRAWHRTTLLSILALLFLYLLKAHHQDDDALDLSAGEVRRLLRIPWPAPIQSPRQRWRWSLWRRRHNLKAKLSHYRRQQRRLRDAA